MNRYIVKGTYTEEVVGSFRASVDADSKQEAIALVKENEWDDIEYKAFDSNYFDWGDDFESECFDYDDLNKDISGGAK